ncbi:hypothetical protein HKCCE2091_09480 [Rhodobacterales bacterium HKCCE2091]|nr:hypothetical protein [Rhodobacterales bacterium HKCCE2091]
MDDDWTDPLKADPVDEATRNRMRRRLARVLIAVGLFPLALLLLGGVLGLFDPCTYGREADFCGDLDDPRVMVPTLLLMSGMYVIFTWPIALAGVLWLRRIGRQG